MLQGIPRPPALTGFMPALFGEGGFDPSALPISRSVGRRGMPASLDDKFKQLERGEFGDVSADQFMMQLNLEMLNLMRTGQTSSGIPIRENLEAEVKVIIPLDTPLRNKLPRVPGKSTATSWEQQTSLGGGYGVNTTVTAGATSATQTVGNVDGMQVGMSLFFETSNVYGVIASITNSTTIVLTASVTTATGETVIMGPYAQPGQNLVQAFFSESGAPATSNAVYAKKSENYKLLGTMLSITGFAMAAGASYDNQLALEKTAAIRRLMLIEEFALINSTSTNIYPPFGDGTNALGFDGLLALIATANGTPGPQVQASVGALTTAHMDQQLARIWQNGGMNPWIMVNAQEALSLSHLAEASGSIVRVQTTDAQGNLGFKVTGYMHQAYGVVPILVSRFMPAGTMVFGSDFLPDGKAALDVDVLPQVQLPELAPTQSIQGYVAQEVAPSVSSPQVYPAIVSVFQTPRMKSATVFAKSTGVTAV